MCQYVVWGGARLPRGTGLLQGRWNIPEVGGGGHAILEGTNNHWIMRFKMVNFMACHIPQILKSSETKRKENAMGRVALWLNAKGTCVAGISEHMHVATGDQTNLWPRVTPGPTSFCKCTLCFTKISEAIFRELQNNSKVHLEYTDLEESGKKFLSDIKKVVMTYLNIK